LEQAFTFLCNCITSICGEISTITYDLSFHFSMGMFFYIRCVSTKFNVMLLTFRKHVGSSPFFDGAVGLILLVFVVALCFYVLPFFVLCLMCPMFPVSLGFSFLVARSVFSNVYLNLCSRDEGHSRHASCALNSVCTIVLHFPQNSSITLNFYFFM
jgi:hypothetical protein